jgi:hypothetical protein
VPAVLKVAANAEPGRADGRIGIARQDATRCYSEGCIQFGAILVPTDWLCAL